MLSLNISDKVPSFLSRTLAVLEERALVSRLLNVLKAARTCDFVMLLTSFRDANGLGGVQ